MSRRSRRSKQNLPEQAIQLKIDRLSHEGRGIASISGKIAFVDGALPDETVTARYLQSRSRYDELVTETVLAPSADRTTPGCAFFGRCGGCSLQHLSTSAQIEFKQQLLLDQLHHAIGVSETDISLLPFLQGEPYNYRRKARLAVRFVAKKGGALVGFREKYSRFITEMDDCRVLVEPVASLINPLRELVSNLESRLFIPQFEVAAGDAGQKGHQVALVMRHMRSLSNSDLDLILKFAERHQCDFYLQPKGVDTIHKIWPEDGPQRLQYCLPDYDLVMNFHPSDFIQVNGIINRQLIPLAIELLDLKAEDRVLDLFCGLGNFTLPIARHCDVVAGIEGSEVMVQRAMENAELNHVGNAEFHVANLYEAISNHPWSEQDFTKILLDPPRSGAIELIDFLVRQGAQKIVYISCNPATLVRDAAKLIEKGYTLNRVGVIDMFPHTAHVESIAEFNLQ